MTPKHPYTRALLLSMPRMTSVAAKRLTTIEGMVPSALDRPRGCTFHPRCAQSIAGLCERTEPVPVSFGEDHVARCLLYGSPQ